MQVVTLLLFVAHRQSTAPCGILAITVSLSVTHIILFAEERSPRFTGNLLAAVKFALPLLSTIIIIRMPLRDPALSNQDICAPFETPTCQLRSPEDNLTPWQFMTVAWMSSLMAVGCKRQLNDEDVWSLSLEFQHKALHENFRVLKGSVIKRLLVANGIDLVIITALGLLEIVASMH